MNSMISYHKKYGSTRNQQQILFENDFEEFEIISIFRPKKALDVTLLTWYNVFVKVWGAVKRPRAFLYFLYQMAWIALSNCMPPDSWNIWGNWKKATFLKPMNYREWYSIEERRYSLQEKQSCESSGPCARIVFGFAENSSAKPFEFLL